MKSFIILFLIANVLTQNQETTTSCVAASANARSYADCSQYNDTASDTICCFVQGTSGGTDGSSCLDVDILFEGKTISYDNNGVTGKLICTNGDSSKGYFIIYSRNLLLVLIILILS